MSTTDNNRQTFLVNKIESPFMFYKFNNVTYTYHIKIRMQILKLEHLNLLRMQRHRIDILRAGTTVKPAGDVGAREPWPTSLLIVIDETDFSRVKFFVQKWVRPQTLCIWTRRNYSTSYAVACRKMQKRRKTFWTFEIT